MNLEDKISEEVRRKLNEQYDMPKYYETELVVGCVLRMHVQDTNPPKVKRFVVVGKSGDNINLATVFINSRIHPYIAEKPHLAESQVHIDPGQCSFIDHDSYIDCSKIVSRSFQDIISGISADTIMGHLSDTLKTEVLSRIKAAKNIPLARKKEFNLLS